MPRPRLFLSYSGLSCMLTLELALFPGSDCRTDPYLSLTDIIRGFGFEEPRGDAFPHTDPTGEATEESSVRIAFIPPTNVNADKTLSAPSPLVVNVCPPSWRNHCGISCTFYPGPSLKGCPQGGLCGHLCSPLTAGASGATVSLGWSIYLISASALLRAGSPPSESTPPDTLQFASIPSKHNSVFHIARA